MEDSRLINYVIERLKEENLWFTTKSDPTFEEPKEYYDLDKYGEPVEKARKRLCKEIKRYVGDGAIDLQDAVELWIQEAQCNYSIAYKEILKTKFEPKPVVPGLNAYESQIVKTESIKKLKTEDAKTRLKEENSKSANAIADAIADENFDEESKSGKIILRTKKLFNALSDKGYDVQVNFDNGESTNILFLGQSGGQVVITIINESEKLKVFASGNYEVTQDIIDKLNDIRQIISDI